MNKTITLIIIIAIIILSLSCSFLESTKPVEVVEEFPDDSGMEDTVPAPTNNPTVAPETQTDLPEPTATPKTKTDIPQPTATTEKQNVNLDSVELGGGYRTFWVVFDPEIWQVGEDDWGPNLIKRDDPTWILRENPAMGVPPGLTVQQDQKQIAGYEVDISQYISGNSVSLEIFYFNSETIFIAISTGDDTENCLEAARDVIERSAENRFEPQQ